jgi:hypothetical protein
MPGYSYLTLAGARAEVAARLEDPTYVYWKIPELNDLIDEGLRAWGALTSTYKQRATFNIAPGTGVNGSVFYSLANLPAGILSYYFTDQQAVNMVLAALLEPPLTTTWTGTGQFSFGQIMQALQDRINTWVSDTGSGVTRNIQNVGSGPTASRVFLPDAVLDVRRAAWRTPSGVYTTLWRDDEYAMQAFRNPGSLTPVDPPLVWGKFTIPPVGIEVYPPPLNPGEVETLVVTSGPQVGTNPAAVVNTPTVLNIPENFVWGVVFGVLSDLLSADGPARDPARAAYAESRCQESVELYRIQPTLLQTQINGVPVWTGSVFEMDAFLASWQSQPGPPQFAGMAGRNLVAFGPVPDASYSVAVDVAANMPLTNGVDTAYLQVDRGAIDPLLDYVQHLASFKMAGAEFAGSDKLRQNFYTAAALENARIKQGSFYKTALEKPALLQGSAVPRI